MQIDIEFYEEIIENSYVNEQGLHVVYSDTPKNLVKKFKEFNADYKKIYGTEYFIFE